MSRLRWMVSDLRAMPVEQLLVLGVVGVVFLPLVLPCLLVSLPFAGIRQAGR